MNVCRRDLFSPLNHAAIVRFYLVEERIGKCLCGTIIITSPNNSLRYVFLHRLIAPQWRSQRAEKAPFISAIMRPYIHPSVCLLLRASVRPSVHYFIRSSTTSSVRPSTSFSVRTSVCPSVHYFVRSFVYPVLRPSIHLFNRRPSRIKNTTNLV